MKRLRVKLKYKLIIFIVFLLMTSILGIGVPSYFYARQGLEEKAELILSNAVEMAIDKIETWQIGVEHGFVSLEDAQEAVKSYLIGPMRENGTRSIKTPIDLGKHGYFLAYNDLGYEVMHPNQEGTYVYDTETPNDNILVVQEQLKLGKEGGFLQYDWYYPNQEKVGRKLSYSKYDATWGWTIVATAYASDFNEAASQIAIFMFNLLMFVVVLGIVFTYDYMNRLIKPVYDVTKSMKLRAKGQLERVSIPKAKDELYDLVLGYNEMTDSLDSYINDLKEKETYLSQLAFVDDMTQLPNMNGLEKHIYNISNLSNKGKFMILDIKGQKTLNSLHGIPFGNQIIINIANRLETHKPTLDTHISRIGGNEFGVWIPNGDEIALKKWLHEFLDYWEQAFNTNRMSQRIEFTISCVNVDLSSISFDTMLRHANIALQFAKSKDLSFAKYEEDIHEMIERESILKISLEKALDTDEIYPVYQEKVSLINEEVLGVEVLARWHSKELGFVSPGEFIPLLNHSKLMMRFTEKIVDCALKDYKKLKEKYNESIKVSINISPNVILSKSFIIFLSERTQFYSVPNKNIILEITEDVFIGQSIDINKKINALRDQGFKISLDDFGTGYSSLSYLKQMSLDEVKIDKSLIDDIVEDQRSMQMLQSVVEVIHNLGFESVAEGVETEEQLRLVKRTGCNIVQGYYYSKPARL